jgi:8-oxo-dGTP diphosphatase
MDLNHIHAAGGIVVRNHRGPRIGIVQLRRNKAWVLPKGKLNKNESPLAAARREVWEETGYAVSVHEFVGAVTYKSRGKPKVVQFWRMQAAEEPSRKRMRDVRAVEWLPLHEAVARLTRAHERIFLTHIGPVVLRTAREQDRETEGPRVAREKERPAERPRAAKPARKKAPARPRLVPAKPVKPSVTEPAIAPAAPPPRLHIVAPVPAARAVTPAPQRRPWLQRTVLDRLFGRARSRRG